MTEKKQGTGKHGHKDSKEASEHRVEHQQRGEGHQASSREQEKGGSEKESLKSREHRDERGERHGEKERDR